MLRSPLLVGVLAGFGAALLFASATTGTAFAALLFYATPLPLFVAGLGFGAVALLASIAAATAATAFFYSLWIGLAFALGIGVPAGLLARLPQLGQPVDPADPKAGVIWYPTGRIVLWAAGLGTLVTGAAVLIAGFGGQDFQTELTGLLTKMLETGRSSGLLPEGADLGRIAEILAIAIPPGAAAIWTSIMLFNLWLGARVVSASGGLARPWPRVSDMAFPRATAAVFAATMLGTFLEGEAGLIAGVLAAALFVAYLILGLAALHHLTERWKSRGLILTAFYLALLILPWTALFLAALGLADNVGGVRTRLAQGKPPSPKSAKTGREPEEME